MLAGNIIVRFDRRVKLRLSACSLRDQRRGLSREQVQELIKWILDAVSDLHMPRTG